MTATLTSKWGSLSPRLLASIYPVDFKGQPLEAFGNDVQSPLTDANIELSGNWQSAFEHAGPEAKAPTLMAMLQSGTLSNMIQSIYGKSGNVQREGSAVGYVNFGIDTLVNELQQSAAKAQGRSGMTKLNSTQIFTGAAPVKITGTLHFRAYSDPSKEVQQPVDQLSKWVLSQNLSKSGVIVNIVQALKTAVDTMSLPSLLQALLPSTAPPLLGLRYGGYTFSPLVLESLGRPLTVPMTKAGEPLHISLPFTLASLTALDAGDWDLARQGKPTAIQ